MNKNVNSIYERPLFQRAWLMLIDIQCNWKGFM